MPRIAQVFDNISCIFVSPFYFFLDFFASRCTEYAIANAWRFGLPAFISARTLCSNAFLLVDFFKGIIVPPSQVLLANGL